MKLKKVLSLSLAAVMTTALLAGCGDSSGSKKADDSNGKVYFLNNKPEDAEVFDDIAKAFTDETGIPMEVQTAAAGTYGPTLKSELAKTEAPTLFQFNGLNGYQNCKDYCSDLSDSDFYSYLTDKELTVSTDDGIWGIATTIEGYGIIANKAIVEEYTKLSGAKISSIDEINNFETLNAVAEDIQAKKDELGIEGAFASTSFSPGEEWRWHTHLFNLPLYYEFQDRNVEDADELEGLYLADYKKAVDMYLENSITDPAMLSGKTVADSMAEFALGQVAFVQNGDWAWGDIEGNDVEAEDITYLPIYIDVDGEEEQGLCIGTENYWTVNSQAPEKDQEATYKFIDWLFNTDKGKDFVVNDLGWTAPFNTFGDDEAPGNPLAQSILEYAESGKTAVSWVFDTMPTQTYKDKFGAALLEYAQGTDSWDNVEKVIIDTWASEKADPTEDAE